MVCQISNYADRIYLHGEEENKSVKFWDLKQLTNKSLKIEEVLNKDYETVYNINESFSVCSMVGSNIYTSEENILVQRSFWP